MVTEKKGKPTTRRGGFAPTVQQINADILTKVELVKVFYNQCRQGLTKRE